MGRERDVVARNNNWNRLYGQLDVVLYVRRLECETSRMTPHSAFPKITADPAFHVALADRVMVLHHQRHGRWPKIKSFLSNNSLSRFAKRYRLRK